MSALPLIRFSRIYAAPILLVALLLCAPIARAATYYWDANDATAGFGTAGGTWAAPTTNDATQGWSTSSAGTSSLSGTTTTTTSDALNFGTSSAGLAAGTITVSGNVSSAGITFGNASGNITLSGGHITLNGDIGSSAASPGITHTITSNITLNGAARGFGSVSNQRFIFTGVIGGASNLTADTGNGVGAITLNGTNTFTGNFQVTRGQVNFNSLANAGQNSALGAGSRITSGGTGAQTPLWWYTGASSASSNRTWNLQGSTTTITAQNGSLLLSGNFNAISNFDSIIQLTGTADSGTNEISGVISNAPTGYNTFVTIANSAPQGGSTEAGFWILSGNNSYNGTTTISNSGILRIAHANALGTTANGTTVQSGSALELAGGISVGAEALTLGSAGISSGGGLRNISGNNSYAGVITLGSAARINSDANTLTLTGGITGTNNLEIGGAGNTIISGNVTTSTGTLTKDGNGTLTLSGNNTYTGATTISAGTLKVGSTTGLASGSAFTVSGGILDLNGYNATVASLGAGNAAGTITNSAAGSGVNILTISNLTTNVASLITDGATARTGLLFNNNSSIPWLSNANNTFSGGVTIANGGAATRMYQLGAVSNTLAGNGTLLKSNFGTGNILIGANGSTSIAQFALTTTNTEIYNGIVFNAASTYSDGGKAAFRADASGIKLYGTLTAGASDISFSSGGTGAVTAFGQLTGTNGLTLKTSNITLTLTNNSLVTPNDYSGSTTIETSGTLVLGAANQISNGAGKGNVTISGTLRMGGFSETINGLSGNGTIDGVSGTPTLIVGDNDATSTFSGVIKNTAGTLALTKIGNGTLSLSGANTYSGGTTVNAGTLSINVGSGISGALVMNNGTTVLGNAHDALNALTSITMNGSTLSNTATGYLLRGFNGALTMVDSTITGNGGDFGAASYTLSGNNTISGPKISLGSGNFNVTSGTTTISSVLAYNLSGPTNGSLQKSGAGLLILSGNNTSSANVTISAGTLEIGAAGRLMAGNYNGTISNSAAFIYSGTNSQTLSGVISGTGAITQNGTGMLTLSNAANTYNGSTTVNAGTLAVSGNISSSALTINSGGVISAGTTAAITKFNAASLTVAGDSGYAFTIGNISGGTAGTAGTDYDQIATSGAITFNNTAANPFTVYINGTPTNWSSAGSYTWNILSGSSLSGFSSGNFVADYSSFGGALAAGASWTFGASGGNLTLTYGTGGTPTWAGGTGVWSGNFTPSLSNNLDMLFTGAGGTATNDIASGTLSSVGTITFNSTAGSYTLAANSGSAGNGSTLNVAGSIVNNSANAQTINNALAFTGVRIINTASGNITLGGAISGAGGITKNGSSTLTLSGNNTYSGATTISAGTLQIGGAGLLGGGNYSNTISNSGTLLYTSTANQTLSGVISGAGALTQNAASTLTLSGNNTYSGATTISAGTLAIAAAGRLGGGTYAGNISNNGSLIHAGTNNQTLSGVISGTGALTQNAASTLTLSGNNTYTGATTINAGTLLIGAAGRLGGGNYTGNISNSGLLVYSGTNAQTLSGVISGAGALTQNAASTLTLSGNNTYSGGTTLTTGTLQVTSATGLGTGNLTAAVNTKLLIAPGGGNLTIANNMSFGGGAGNLETSAGNTTLTGLLTNTGGISHAGSGTLLINGGITSANNSSLVFGWQAIVNSAISIGTGEMYFSGGTSRINSSGNTFGNIILYFGGNLTLGATNAITPSSKIRFGWAAAGQSTATLNLNGYDQTVASLEGALGNYDTQNTSITGGGVLTVNQTAAQAYAYGGRITDGVTATSLTKNGSGTLMLQNWSGINSTYSGATTINAGTLMILAGNGTSLSSNSAYTVASGAVLSVNGTSQGIGSLAGAGTVQNGNASTASTLTMGADNSSTTFSGTIQNGGAAALAITKNGTGTLTLSSTNTYTGATTVNGGTLQLSSNITSSALTLGTGSVISLGDTSSTAKYNASSITIQGGTGYAFTINTVNTSVAGTDYDQLASAGALTLNNTAANPFTITLHGTPTGWSNTGNYSWNIISAASQTGFNSGNFAVNLTNFGITSGNRTGTWTFTNPSGGNITLTYAAATPDYIWSGTSGDWSTGFTPTAPVTDKNLVFTGAGGTATNNIGNGTLSSLNFITFNSSASSYTLAANAGSAGASGGTALSVKGDIVNNSSSAQTINMALALGGSSSGIIDTAAGNITIGGVISGTGVVTKNGNSTLTLSAANTYTGGVIVNAGTLVLSAANVHTGATAINGGTLSLTGNLSGGTAITTAGSGAFTQGAASIISGTASLTQNSSGTTTLAGANTYNGSTALRAGTLHINNATAIGTGTLTIAGGTVDNTTGSAITLSTNNVQNWNGNFTFTGTKDLNLGTGAVTMNSSRTVTVAAGNLTVGGVISGTGYSLTKNGSGTLILSGLNTYSGGTNINAGILDLRAAATNAYNTGNNTFNINNASTLLLNTGVASNPTAQGMVVNFGSNGGGTLTLGSGLNFLLQNTGFFINTNGGAQNLLSSAGGNINDQGTATAVIFDVASGSNATADLLVTGGLSNRSGLTKNGAGKLLFQNTAIGSSAGIFDIRINQGTMEFGGTSTLNQYSGRAFTNNGTLSWNSTANQTIANAITGTGNLTKSNTSTLTLSNSTTSYTGLTTVNAGALAIGNNMTIGAIAGAGNLSLGTGFTLTTNASSNTTFSGVISGAGALAKSNTSTLTLSGNNTYSGTTTINAGTLQITSTGLLGGGSYSGNIANSGALIAGSNSNQTLSGVISGTGALTKNGTGTLTLLGSNSYSGGTTLNTGTIVIGHTNAAGTGTMTQSSGSSLLKIDTTGTITNAMSVYNVAASQSATLSGAITVNNATWDIETGDTLTISGAVSGSGGVTKNGNGTLVLSGNNSYSGASVVNAGTLNAASANALGSNNTVQVTGGTLLVSADNAINNKSVTLNSTSTTMAGLAFSGNYSGLVDNLTLSQNSIIDLGEGSVSIMFDTFVMSTYTLDIYNWTGTTLWNGGTGNDTDKVYFGPDLSDAALAKIYFHSGAVGGGDSFLGSGYDLGLQQTSWDSGLEGYHIIPVPEPETYATGLLLLLGGALWMWKRNRKPV